VLKFQNPSSENSHKDSDSQISRFSLGLFEVFKSENSLEKLKQNLTAGKDTAVEEEALAKTIDGLAGNESLPDVGVEVEHRI
jgi:hypothetical protein